MNSPAIGPSYCLNPSCLQPENAANDRQCQSCGAELFLQDRYRALRLIGQGGFGRTFLAVDHADSTAGYCVIKQFLPQQWDGQSRIKASALFQQEAMRLAILGDHPHIPKLLAFFEDANWQYLVQEFIDGQNLAQELAVSGRFNETQIRQLLQDVLPILQFVHHHHVIHRDIKPENLIRRRHSQRIVLVDFGAAKYTTETTLGKTGTMIGSAAYTSPEQVRGKATYASDLYSLGVTCIHLLTQISPFELFDSHEGTWIWQHYLPGMATRKIRRWNRLDRAPRLVSAQLSAILNKMLQTGTNYRYQTAIEILRDLHSGTTPARRRFQKRWVLAGSLLIVSLFGIRYTADMLQRQALQPPPSATPYYQAAPSRPVTAGLYTQTNGEQRPLPLQHTEVMARVSGNVSRVEVTQTFTNPYTEPLEAVYVFPLPDESAVDDMEIRVGDRLIRGSIKRREEAKQIYEQAQREGQTVALLEQERDNIFTQSLANIRPGEKINVTIRYTDSLKFEKGNYEFAFPLVVGQRYLAKDSPITDAARISPPVQSDDGTSKSAIGLTIELDAGVPIKTVTSPSHRVETTPEGRVLRVQLADADPAVQDFVLRYQVADAETRSTVLTEADQRGGHFAAYLIPAVQYQPQEIVPKDIVFLIDTSGSQAGEPLKASKELMRRFIKGLNPKDTFAIVDFASTTSQLAAYPLPNTPANQQRALNYIDQLTVSGGTELMQGIQTVMAFPPAPVGRLRSVVLLTDGLIGDDEQVIATVAQELQPGNRLYSFGVGPDTNRFLVDRLAELGRGTSQILLPGEPITPIVERFFQQINNPVLTNLEVTWEGEGDAPELSPGNAPDLFAHQPLVIVGRKLDRRDGVLRIQGTMANGQLYDQRIAIEFADTAVNPLSGGIAQLWGRARIKALMNQIYLSATPDRVKAVTQIALEYRLMSKYTAFVAVSQEKRVDPNSSRRVVVPVPSSQDPASEAVPEPEQILGTLTAAIFLLLRLGRKSRRSSS